MPRVVRVAGPARNLLSCSIRVPKAEPAAPKAPADDLLRCRGAALLAHAFMGTWIHAIYTYMDTDGYSSYTGAHIDAYRHAFTRT